MISRKNAYKKSYPTNIIQITSFKSDLLKIRSFFISDQIQISSYFSDIYLASFTETFARDKF